MSIDQAPVFDESLKRGEHPTHIDAVWTQERLLGSTSLSIIEAIDPDLYLRPETD